MRDDKIFVLRVFGARGLAKLEPQREESYQSIVRNYYQGRDIYQNSRENDQKLKGGKKR